MPPPFKLTGMRAAAVAADRARGMTMGALAQKYGVHRNTIYRTLRRDVPEETKRAPCGTIKAYWDHVKYGELRDKECLKAHAAQRRQQYWAKKQRDTLAYTAETRSA